MSNKEFKQTGHIDKTYGVFTRISEDPASFLVKLRGGAQEIHEVSLAHTSVYMRLLTVKEERESELKARKLFNELDEKVRLAHMADHYLMLCTLEKAMEVESTDGKIKSSVLFETLQLLPRNQLITLYKKYADLCDLYDLREDFFLDDKAFNDLVDQIEKKKAYVKSLSRTQLEELVLSLLEKIDTLMDSLHTLSSVGDMPNLTSDATPTSSVVTPQKGS